MPGLHLIILGTGCHSLLNHFPITRSIAFDQFLDFPIHPLEGHDRKLHIAHYNDTPFIALSGRLHYYEGYSIEQIQSPIRYVLNNYKVASVTLTSASGAIDPNIKVGEWQRVNNFISIPSVPFISDCKVPPSHPIWHNLNNATYAFHQGPSLGTMAEYKMLSQMGADLVGMSMLPEAIILNKLNTPFQVLSLPVCNYSPFDLAKEPSHKEVMKIAAASIDALAKQFKSYLTS